MVTEKTETEMVTETWKIVKDQLTFACLKSTIEALEKVVKYV